MVSSLGPTDYSTLHTILAMATYGEDPTLGRPCIQNIQPIKVHTFYSEHFPSLLIFTGAADLAHRD